MSFAIGHFYSCPRAFLFALPDKAEGDCHPEVAQPLTPGGNASTSTGVAPRHLKGEASAPPLLHDPNPTLIDPIGTN